MGVKERNNFGAAADCRSNLRGMTTAGRWRRRCVLRLVIFWLAIAFISFSDQSASAHTEGKMQLSAQPAGPFKMTVFTSPDPAVVGDIHVAALIFTAEDASPVLDADVTIKMESVNGSGTPQFAPATLGDAENKLLFEAIINVDDPGAYIVTITAEDSEGGSGDASFELEVESEGGFNWLYLIPVLAVLLVAALWLFNRSRPSKTSA